MRIGCGEWAKRKWAPSEGARRLSCTKRSAHATPVACSKTVASILYSCLVTYADWSTTIFAMVCRHTVQTETATMLG